MSCSEYSESIAEWLDGTLDPVKHRALERHVESCAACRALVADLRSIEAAAFTLERHEPPAHVLDSLRARIASEAIPSTRGRLLAWPRSRAAWAGWAAAAVLLLATLASVYPLLQQQSASHVDEQATAVAASDDPMGSVLEELQAAEGHYDKAIQELEQIARSDTGALDPQVAGVLQKNLQVIDQAIGESRAALKTQPASADAQESLFDAMRSKVALLQQTVELINEMRKGNQAEAGRLIQGLNQ